MSITEEDKIVACNIKRLREKHSLSRRELEEKADISFGILDQIEAFHKAAGKSIRKRLVDCLLCSYAELYYHPEEAGGGVGGHEPKAEYEVSPSLDIMEY